MAQHLRQLGAAELASSPLRVNRCQPHLLTHADHLPSRNVLKTPTDPGPKLIGGGGVPINSSMTATPFRQARGLIDHAGHTPDGAAGALKTIHDHEPSWGPSFAARAFDRDAPRHGAAIVDGSRSVGDPRHRLVSGMEVLHARSAR